MKGADDMANYFTVERDGNCFEHIDFRDDNGNIVFKEVLSMTYDELKSYKHIEEFVVCVMDSIDKISKCKDDQTIITLVGDDDVFIWSILMFSEDNDKVRYSLVNWRKDGKKYRYEKN